MNVQFIGMKTTHSAADIALVPETRIGLWFLGTQTWTTHVLRVALDDLERLMPQRQPSYPIVLDAGCGQGKSFRLLIEHFSPQRLIGVDAEVKCLQHAQAEALKEKIPIRTASLRYRGARCRRCQRGPGDFAIRPFTICRDSKWHWRKCFACSNPAGYCCSPNRLAPISTRGSFACCFAIRCMCSVSAAEYLAMIRDQGFTFGSQNVSLPYLWWSRSDLGAFEWFGFGVPTQREETLVNLVASETWLGETRCRLGGKLRPEIFHRHGIARVGQFGQE